MVNKSIRTIQFPVKIGEEVRVIPYSASLTEGEEQLLVTRNGKLFLTNGKGGFIDFRSNNVYTKPELDAILKANSDNIDGVVEYINSEISDVREYALGMDIATNKKVDKNTEDIKLNKDTIEENKNSIESNLESFKNDTETSILSIEDSIKSILEKLQDSNVDISDILKLIGDINLLEQDIKSDDVITAINTVYNKTVLGKHLIADAINYKMPSLNASGEQSYVELSDLIKEIKTGGFGGPTIEDFSEHTSLPSFSKHAKLKTFEAKE